MAKPVQASTFTFRDIIESDFLYVDKTRYLYELVRYGKGIYFIARPRRFGKSLMVSTLAEIFQGNRELFQGLWIDQSDYEWQPHPVLRFDFSRHGVKSAAKLEQVIDYFIDELARQHGITLRGFDYQTRFDNLILQLGSGEHRVVILIDEYDKPIIDNLDNLTEATAIREVLRNFYTIIKAMDSYIRFVFVTGISKFSKVGVFSTMNTLDDLTMDPRFATALGITEEELTRDLTEHIAEFAAKLNITPETLRDQIREWYNGFCFVENCARVYNSYSTLQLFKKQYFANYWFETGTPTFLIKLLHERNYEVATLEHLVLKEIDFSTYELDHLDIVALLFQTGYLTIKDAQVRFGEETIFTLSYPNREVENAFLTYLLSAFSSLERTLSRSHLYELLAALRKHDLDQMFTVLRTFFANVPYTLQVDREAYYQTVFYILFKMIGIETEAEVVTNDGRIDTVVMMDDHIFLFEFKLNGSAMAALAQIKEKEYFQKYWLTGKPITCVGANFDTTKRTVSEWESAEITP